MFKKYEREPEAAPPVVSLEKMGHLVSVKLNYADVIEFSQPRAVDIPWSQREVRLGGTKVLFVARGDCTVATDLRQARYADVDPQRRTLTVVLPQPAPLQARIIHAPREQGGSFFYAITEHGLQPFIPSAGSRTRAMNTVLAAAQRKVGQACSEGAVIASARNNAESVLGATLAATGWTPAFRWR